LTALVTMFSVVIGYSHGGKMSTLHDFHHLPEICCHWWTTSL